MFIGYLGATYYSIYKNVSRTYIIVLKNDTGTEEI
jgi:hypothetical protein